MLWWVQFIRKSTHFVHWKRKSKGLSDDVEAYYHGSRSDPCLIETIKELGSEADGNYAKLQIVSIPEKYPKCYKIYEYDDLENVICNGSQIIKNKLESITVNDLTNKQYRNILSELR